MSEHDFRAELEMWCDLWDSAQESGVHPPAQVPQPSKIPSGDTTQDFYYDYVDSELLQEEKIPNPVYPDSVGPDHTTTPPVWTSEDLLKEVESLKNKLFDVENKMAKMGGDKKWTEKVVEPKDKFMAEIESIRTRLDKVSSQLGIEHEPSPWQVKKS